MTFLRTVLIAISLVAAVFMTNAQRGYGQSCISEPVTTYACKMLGQVLTPLKGTLNELGMNEVRNALGTRFIPFSIASAVMEVHGLNLISADQVNKALTQLSISNPVRWSRTYTSSEIAQLATEAFERTIATMTDKRFLEPRQSLDPFVAYMKAWRVVASGPEYIIDAGLTPVYNKTTEPIPGKEIIEPLFPLPDDLMRGMFPSSPDMPNLLGSGTIRYREISENVVPVELPEALSYVQASVASAEHMLRATDPANLRIRSDARIAIQNGLDNMAQAFSIEQAASLPKGQTTLTDTIHRTHYRLMKNIVERAEGSLAHAIALVPSSLDGAMQGYALRGTITLRTLSDRTGIALQFPSLINQPLQGQNQGSIIVATFRQLAENLQWNRALRPATSVVTVFGE